MKKRFTILLFVELFVLSLAACHKSTYLTAFEFTEKMDELDFSYGKYIRSDCHTCYEATYKDDRILVQYMLFKEKGDAGEYFSELYEDVKQYEKDGCFEGKNKKKDGKLVIDGNFSAPFWGDVEGDFYCVTVRDDEMVICVWSWYEDSDKEVDKVVKSLGY